MILENILQHPDMNVNEHENLIHLFLDQIENLLSNRRRYSHHTKKFAFCIFAYSPKAYQALCKYLLLPSEKYVRRMENDLNVDPSKEQNNDKYLRKRLQTIPDTPAHRTVLIAIDEMYIEPGLTRQGNNNTGYAENDPDKLAKTVLAIMIICPFDTWREIYCYVAVSSLSEVMLEKILLNVIRRLQVIHGLCVLGVVSDGLSTNVTLFERLTGGTGVSFENPCIPGRRIFTMFDWVHLFKNIRNCFANNQILHYFDWDDPGVKKHAKWSDIESLYHLEKNQTIRLAPKLTHAAIYPSNFVR